MAKNDNVEEAHSVLNSFRCLVKALRVADRAGLKEHGLGASQLFVLHELKQESPLSVNDLADRTATDQSTVSVVVSKLIAKGFVSSERSEDDARRVHLTLTAKGHLLAKQLPPPIQHLIIRGVEQLPPARAKALAASLRDICGVLGVTDEHPPMFFADSAATAPRSSSKGSPSAKKPRSGKSR